MQTREGEFRSFLLHAVLPRDGVHPQPSFQHEPLAHLHPVLKILGKVAPAHDLEFARGIIGTQRIKPNGHFRNRSLVVLGVANRGCFDHLHFEHAVVHGPVQLWESS